MNQVPLMLTSQRASNRCLSSVNVLHQMQHSVYLFTPIYYHLTRVYVLLNVHELAAIPLNFTLSSKDKMSRFYQPRSKWLRSNTTDKVPFGGISLI